MGNTCGKNAAKAQTPEQAGENLQQLQEQRNRLANELDQWRKTHEDEMRALELQYAEAEKEADILLGHGSNSMEMRANAEADAVAEIEEIDSKHIELFNKAISTVVHTTGVAKDKQKELEALANFATETSDKLMGLIQQINDTTYQNGISETDEALKARRLAIIADYYRPIPRPENVTELVNQLRLDAAECSTHTMQNIKALVHHLRTGDTSHYHTKPIRGIVCQTLKLGEKPHDKWSCDVCDYIDNSDLPLLP